MYFKSSQTTSPGLMCRVDTEGNATFRVCWTHVRAVFCAMHDIANHALLPPHRIGDRVAEHVEEGGLEEGVEMGEGLAALGPQGVRRIQNPRNPLLFVEGGEGESLTRRRCDR